MVTSQPLVYVIILNWNLKGVTVECVESVLKSTYSPYQVLIVDNGSTDGSVEVFRSLFPGVEVIANDKNLGWASGNNVGIEYALHDKADCVLLLNNDTIVDENLLAEMVTVGESDKEIGILGPLIFYYDEPDKIWHLGGRESCFLPVPRTLAKNQKDKGQFASPISVDYVSGCAMLVKRQVFEMVGLMDTKYFMYYDETDFCRRAREAGFRIVAVPRARMWHKVSRSARMVSSATRYHHTKNRVLFYHAHPHGPHPLLTDIYIVWHTLARASLDLLMGRWDLIRPTLRGLCAGFREREDLNSPLPRDGD